MYSIKNSGFTAICLAAFSLAVGTNAQSFLTNGLLAYYPLNGSAVAASGNGHTGTVFGATPSRDRFSRDGGALTVQGAQDHILAPVDFTNAQKVTISAWVRFANATDGKPHPIFNRDDNRKGIILSYTSYGTLSFFVGGWTGVDYPFSPVSNKWYFVAGSYDGQQIRIYVDGTLALSNPFVGGISYAENGVNWIGNGNLGGNVPLNGAIDDLRIYNRALSDLEVKDLYAYESHSPAWIGVEVKTVQVTLHVIPTVKYQLQASVNLDAWTSVGDPFTATTSEIVHEFNSIELGRFFRLQEIP